MENRLLYASPYIVVTPQGYTKHYYAESERIASRIGNGGLEEIDLTVENIEDLLEDVWVGETQPIWDEVELSQYHINRLYESRNHFTDAMTCAGEDPLVEENRLEGLRTYWQYVQDEGEPLCYWYHPDHLGSSSWITEKSGHSVQHLHYLPWGEDFVDQRTSSWSALHTFSAKEKDVETGLSYFGSRYYSSDLSIWLSVDPMSDKYPSLSPYVYCANNPVKLVDPNGEEVVLETIYKKDANGNNTSEVERYNIKITGKIINDSGMKIDMEKARNQIVEQIESSFSGTTEDGIPVSVTADLQVVNSFRQISDKDHLFSLDDGVTVNGCSAQGSVNKIGGKTAHIDAHLFRGPYDNLLHSGAKVATHEMGHLFGLEHGDSDGLFDVIRSPRLGTNVSSRQLSLIIHKLKLDKTVPRCYRLLNITDR